MSWAVLPLRLTARGHEFIEALRNKEVWVTIKRSFKEASISTLWNVSQKLIEAYTKKKIEALLKDEE
jgi:ABC-type sulfate transport system permease component